MFNITNFKVYEKHKWSNRTFAYCLQQQNYISELKSDVIEHLYSASSRYQLGCAVSAGLYAVKCHYKRIY